MRINFKLKLFVFFIALFSSAFLFNNNIEVLLYLFLFLTLTISFSSYAINKDWKSPFFIIPILSLLYYGVFPLYFNLGGLRTYGVEYSDVVNSLRASLLFVYGFILSFLILKIKHREKGLICYQQYTYFKFNNFVSRFILLIFLVTFCYSFVQIRSVAGMSKEDRMLTNAVSFAVFFGGIYFYYSFILIDSYVKRKSKPLLVILVLVVGFFGAILLGERDQLIFPVLYFIFIRSYFKLLSVKRVFFLGVILIITLFLLGLYRGADQSGELRELSGLIFFLQENEFVAAGRNISYLINKDIDFLYGQTFLGDVLYSIFINVFPTGSQWYTLNYIENKGLSIVAEAYINFGFYGCFIVGILFSLFLNKLYSISFKSNLYTILYVIVIIASLYCLRSDFASITSGFIKKFFIPLCLLLVVSYFFGVYKIKYGLIKQKIRN